MNEREILPPDALVQDETDSHRAETHGRLSGNLGVFDLTMTVLAASAPLSVVAALVPVAMAVGNGPGMAGSFLLAGAVLMTFAVGFVTMARSFASKGEGAGAFYIYLTKGLGREAGLGGAFLAVYSYTLLQTGTYGMLGVSLVEFFHTRMGLPEIPWWCAAAAAWLAVAALGYRRIDLSARVLGLTMVGEIIVVALLDVAVLIKGGPSGHLDFTPYSPASLFSGNAGVGIMFAAASFLGFESTAIYSEEVRRPDRTIPRATYISIVMIAVLYSVSTFFLVNAYGVQDAMVKAIKAPTAMMPDAMSVYIGEASVDVMYVLLINSLFAAVLSFHNTLARYFFNFGCDGVLPARFSRPHPRHGSPALGSLLQSATVVAVLIPAVILNADPVLQFYAWSVGIGTLGMLLLFAIASFAIIRYLNRRENAGSVWSHRVAPALGLISLTSVATYAMWNFDRFIEASPALTAVFLASIFASFALGLLLARRWRRTRPHWYDEIVTAATNTHPPRNP